MDLLAFNFDRTVPALLYFLRVLVPAVTALTMYGCFVSLKLGKRKEDPVIVLKNTMSHDIMPVLYWENSIGRSRSCDIVLHDSTVSRGHAVLMRREKGWMITDTGSKSGTFVNGRRIKQSAHVIPGDVITMGSTSLSLSRTADVRGLKLKRPSRRHAAHPAVLLWAAVAVQLLLCVQLCLAGDKPVYQPFIPFTAIFVMEWGLYFYSMKVLGRVSFELETVAFTLCGIGIMLISGTGVKNAYMQIAGVLLGIVLFCGIIWFLGDLDRVMRWRIAIGAFAVLLFAANLALGREHNGSKNWIYIGGISIQPSEFIKIAFVFVGASTLDRLQTAKNLTGFIGFSAICLGALFLMKDFGTACVFFITFLIIAFMRSGSFRTIALICAVAAFGAFLILKFKPYVAQRFAVWGHVWEDPGGVGYQQTRVLSYMASGGLFGAGIGKGFLKNVFAGSSDLVFGMMCEELGLVLGIVVVLSIAMLMFYARSDVTRSRSTFYSISACAAAGIMLFQTCLNIFGATDVLPMTGVTLPFISLGGSSMASVWGLLAFIKASDERTYAARRKRK